MVKIWVWEWWKGRTRKWNQGKWSLVEVEYALNNTCTSWFGVGMCLSPYFPLSLLTLLPLPPLAPRSNTVFLPNCRPPPRSHVARQTKQNIQNGYQASLSYLLRYWGSKWPTCHPSTSDYPSTGIEALVVEETVVGRQNRPQNRFLRKKLGLEPVGWSPIARKKLPAPISRCRNTRCDLRENVTMVRDKQVNWSL